MVLSSEKVQCGQNLHRMYSWGWPYVSNHFASSIRPKIHYWQWRTHFPWSCTASCNGKPIIQTQYLGRFRARMQDGPISRSHSGLRYRDFKPLYDGDHQGSDFRGSSRVAISLGWSTQEVLVTNLFFAYWEVPQMSTSFSRFQFCFMNARWEGKTNATLQLCIHLGPLLLNTQPPDF